MRRIVVYSKYLVIVPVLLRHIWPRPGLVGIFHLVSLSVSEQLSGNARKVWLDAVDEAIICANDTQRVIQRYLAALIYFQLGGPDWINCRAAINSNGTDYCLATNSSTISGGDLGSLSRTITESNTRYLDASNECLWFGLHCKTFGFGGRLLREEDLLNDLRVLRSSDYFPITTIDLQANNLSGPMYEEFFALQQLEAIYLDGNRLISGTVPSTIAEVSSLQFLGLADNALSGTLPETLFNLTSLVALDLNNNNFIGTLSNSTGNLVDLNVLQLQNNLFSGPIPIDALLQLQSLGK